MVFAERLNRDRAALLRLGKLPRVTNVSRTQIREKELMQPTVTKRQQRSATVS